MILRQIYFTLADMEDKPSSEKANVTEHFQDAVEDVIKSRNSIKAVRIGDVEVKVKDANQVYTVRTAYDDDEMIGRLTFSFANGSTATLSFADNDVLIVYIHEDTLIVDVKGGCRY